MTETSFSVNSIEKPNWLILIFISMQIAATGVSLMNSYRHSGVWMESVHFKVLIFFVILGLIIIRDNWRLLNRDPRLIAIDDEGISSPIFGAGRIRWSQIRDCTSVHMLIRNCSTHNVSEKYLLSLLIDCDALAPGHRAEPVRNLWHVFDIDLTKAAKPAAELEQAIALCRAKLAERTAGAVHASAGSIVETL